MTTALASGRARPGSERHRAGDYSEAEAVINGLLPKLEPRVNPRSETVGLWNSYWVIMLVLTLLMTEWIWRKRRGLP